MFSSKIDFWQAQRLSAFIRLLALVQIIALVLLYVHDADREFSIRKGDFPVFYTGAVIAHEQRWDCLYDFHCNTELQNSTWPELQGSVHPYVYPPFLAQVLAPLGALPHLAAQGVFVALMALCFFVSLILARSFLPIVAEHFVDSLCVLLLFSPLTFGLFGGQNTALSLLCYSGVLYLVFRGGRRNEVLAGIALGLWFYKPHYPLLILACTVLAQRWHILLGAAIAGVVYYVAGMSVLGPGWPLTWLTLISHYAPGELAHNSYQMVSLTGVVYAFLATSGLAGPRAPSLLVSGFFDLTLGLNTGWSFLRLTKIKDSATQQQQFFDLLIMLGPLVVLISPHTHFYDSALCCFALLRYVQLRSDRAVTAAIVCFILAYFAVSHRSSFAVNPLVLVPLYALLLCVRNERLREV
jgi:hypothetical protein